MRSCNAFRWLMMMPEEESRSRFLFVAETDAVRFYAGIADLTAVSETGLQCKESIGLSGRILGEIQYLQKLLGRSKGGLPANKNPSYLTYITLNS